ncbi:uncharacterized protein LOC143037886 [Oratosquilla oratoria]|uniref:uncharacterized protein LOC143037886 n=1 Tax=Oratosquilla oratoria TaxID=337810 RepID=UPI003F75F2CF
MASLTLLWIISFFLFRSAEIEGSDLVVHIEPRDTTLYTYVGEDLKLTCTASQPNDNWLKVYWVVPTNENERVFNEDVEGQATLIVRKLQETDGGNYTCDVSPAVSPTVKASISVIVRPRGLLSPCVTNSFYCQSGQCLSPRYKCDGKSDCPDGSDEFETICGKEPCADKLTCSDDRCMSPGMCCRESDRSPSNCSIIPNISCCRQLLPPSVLDHDLFYGTDNRRPQQDWDHRADSTVVIGCVVAVANLITVSIIIAVRYHLWRSASSRVPSGGHYHLASLRRTTSNSSSNMDHYHLHNNSSSSTDQYHLHSVDQRMLPNSRIPAWRGDLFSPDIVRPNRGQQNDRRDRLCPNGRSGTVVLCPPANAQPPHYSLIPPVPPPSAGPPPDYYQVVGAPPPPYSSRDNLTTMNDSGSTSSSSMSSYNLPPTNNNGDINGNNTPHLSVSRNLNMQSRMCGSGHNNK